MNNNKYITGEMNMRIKVNLKRKYGGKGQGFDGGQASYYYYRDYYIMFQKDGRTIHEELITIFMPKEWEQYPDHQNKWEILDLVDGNFTFDNYKIPGRKLIEYCIDHPLKHWLDINI